MILTSTEESRTLDKRAMEDYGLPEMVLMENAGASVVALTAHRVDWAGAFAVVVCGTGNNGGDGFVIARHAMARGARVMVLLMGDESHMSEASRLYRGILEKMDVPVIAIDKAADWISYIYKADILVDALIGTGLSKDVTGEKAAMIRLMNEAPGTVISVDIPSGLSSDTGAPMGVSVEADYTVALGSIKRGHVLYPGKEMVGELLYSPIGIPEKARADFPVHLATAEEIAEVMPHRNMISHKGKNGFLAILAGSAGMEGAALLAGQGALHAGGGKVAILTVKEAADKLAAKVPELMVSHLQARLTWEDLASDDFPIPDDLADLFDEFEDDFDDEDDEEEDYLTDEGMEPDCFLPAMTAALEEKWDAYDVLAIGPGIGRDEKTQAFVAYVLTHWKKKIIVDADALFAIGEMKINLKSLPGEIILTPHVGEFAHLTGLSPKEIEAHRIDAAISFAKKNHVVLVLKGAPTVTAFPDGRAYVNTTGNPGMATGGMGDTLTGIITAMAGQGLTIEDAAMTGVYLHGLAADLLAEETPVGYTASEVAGKVPEAMAAVSDQ